MNYKVKKEIQNQVLKQSLINEDDLFRKLVFSIINELPIDKIKKIFDLDVVYGNENSLKKAYEENDTQKAEQIEKLMQNNSSLFTAEIDI